MAFSNQAGDPRYKSPGFAAFLSLLPGLGQVYVGYYHQGFINILVTGSVLSILVSISSNQHFIPIGILFLFFFELYNMIDAWRRAMMYNLTLDGVTDVELPDNFANTVGGKISGSYVGGVVLLVFGLVALSYTAFGLSLQWVEEWWPLAPIAFGAYLIYQAWSDSQK